MVHLQGPAIQPQQIRGLNDTEADFWNFLCQEKADPAYPCFSEDDPASAVDLPFPRRAVSPGLCREKRFLALKPFRLSCGEASQRPLLSWQVP